MASVLPQHEGEFVAEQLLYVVNARVNFRLVDPEAIKAFRESRNISDVEWAELEDQRRRKELRQREQRSKLTGLHYAAEAIDEFLVKYFGQATPGEREFMKEHILREAIVGSDNYSDFSVHQMLSEGVDGVRSRYRRRYLKHLWHAWPAVRVLLLVGAVLLLYGKLDTAFEIIVVSIMLLLYVTLVRIGGGTYLALANFNYAGFIRFRELRYALDIEPDHEEAQTSWNIEKEIKKNHVRLVIADVGNTIINLILFWQLFKLLLL
jgi:hypothetical protein